MKMRHARLIIASSVVVAAIAVPLAVRQQPQGDPFSTEIRPVKDGLYVIPGQAHGRKPTHAVHGEAPFGGQVYSALVQMGRSVAAGPLEGASALTVSRE